MLPSTGLDAAAHDDLVHACVGARRPLNAKESKELRSVDGLLQVCCEPCQGRARCGSRRDPEAVGGDISVKVLLATPSLRVGRD